MTRRREAVSESQTPYSRDQGRAPSLTLPFAKGLEYETELANESKASVESKGAVHVFFAERETRQMPGLAAETTRAP